LDNGWKIRIEENNTFILNREEAELFGAAKNRLKINKKYKLTWMSENAIM
jgi:hypothetical protein